MNVAVMGTGSVGRTIADKLARAGHTVQIGTRDPGATLARPGWSCAVPVVSYAEAAAVAEVVINCTAGTASLAALELAGPENLAGKILMDLANPLDFSRGMPPRLAISNDDSLGEAIQRAFPLARVVKTLNTMSAAVMVDPSRVPGEHDVFVAGNDPEARRAVAGWLKEWFGWPQPIDLGDITAARGLEAWLPLWLRLWRALGTVDFNLKVTRAPAAP